MVNRNQIMDQLINLCPSFRETWKEHLRDIWDRESETILYTDLSAFSEHLVNLAEDDNITEFLDVFTYIERLLFNGDEFVKEAIVIGLFEDLQNKALTKNIKLYYFEQYLGEKSIKAWREIIEFWNS